VSKYRQPLTDYFHRRGARHLPTGDYIQTREASVGVAANLLSSPLAAAAAAVVVVVVGGPES